MSATFEIFWTFERFWETAERILHSYPEGVEVKLLSTCREIGNAITSEDLDSEEFDPEEFEAIIDDVLHAGDLVDVGHQDIIDPSTQRKIFSFAKQVGLARHSSH